MPLHKSIGSIKVQVKEYMIIKKLTFSMLAFDSGIVFRFTLNMAL